MMLKLTYNQKWPQDEFSFVTVLGDPVGIRDLYWLLKDKGIEKVEVTNLDGDTIKENDLTTQPHCHASRLSKHI